MNRELFYELIKEVGDEKEYRKLFAKKFKYAGADWLDQVPQELVVAYDQAVTDYQAALTRVMDQALTYLVDGKGERT